MFVSPCQRSINITLKLIELTKSLKSCWSSQVMSFKIKSVRLRAPLISASFDWLLEICWRALQLQPFWYNEDISCSLAVGVWIQSEGWKLGAVHRQHWHMSWECVCARIHKKCVLWYKIYQIIPDMSCINKVAHPTIWKLPLFPNNNKIALFKKRRHFSFILSLSWFPFCFFENYLVFLARYPPECVPESSSVLCCFWRQSCIYVCCWSGKNSAGSSLLPEKLLTCDDICLTV